MADQNPYVDLIKCGAGTGLGVGKETEKTGLLSPGWEQVRSAMLRQYPLNIEGRWYHNQEVDLDGYSFVRCRFDNCKLTVSKGTFKLDHCFLTGGSILYNAEAQRVVPLYSVPAGREGFLGPAALLRPVWHEDGTFSIG